jgi:hypothetical protein
MTVHETIARRTLGTRHYEWAWNLLRIEKVFHRAVYKKLINSDAFRRLADIRFLGAIDYFIHPTGRQLHRRRHTRLEHTLGVAQLGLFYSKNEALSERDEKLVVCAALLHDIGHAPLSHSLEIPFRKSFHIDHHMAGARIITGDAPNGLGRTIHQILEEENISTFDITSLIAGKSDSAHNFLFAHPINIDTIEAISRSETYLKPHPATASPDALLQALVNPEADGQSLDEFWKLKDRIYQLLIQGPVGLLADYLSIHFVEGHISEFSEDDFFISERTLRKRHPNLFKTLELGRRGGTTKADRQIEVQRRRFFIDETYPKGTVERYQTTKTTTLLPLADIQSPTYTGLSKRLDILAL